MERPEKETIDAEKYLQTTVWDIKSKLCDQLGESIDKFLRHAPQWAKDFFLGDYMVPEEKLRAMKVFRYTDNSIEVIDEKWTIVISMEKENFKLHNDMQKRGEVKNRQWETFLSLSARQQSDWSMQSLWKIESILKMMPADDYTAHWLDTRNRAVKQYFGMLWCEMKWLVDPPNTFIDFYEDDRGYLWVWIEGDEAIYLQVDDDGGQVLLQDIAYAKNLLPARKQF